MGWGDLSSYGSPLAQTPNLDQLAAEGTRLTQFYAGAPICSPSRATMFTGQYAARSHINSFLSATHENRAKDNVDHLALDRPSLARTLQQGGYATGHFGKWHLGGGRDVGYATAPTPGTNAVAPRVVEYGFDAAWTQFEGLGNRIINVQDYGGDAQGTVVRPSPFLNHLNQQSDARGTGGGLDQLVYLEREYNAQFMVDRAIEFVDARQQADPQQALFVNLWLDEVHTPHDPPPSIVARYNNDPAYAHLPQHQRNYLAVLESTDQQIGRLVDYLDARGLGDNTLILVTADNGADPDNVALLDSSGPFRGSKGDVFEGGIREPLIARWTGTVPAGRVDNETVLGMADLFPTLTAIAGVANPAAAAFDGENLAPALLGQETLERTTPLYWNTNRGIENRHSSVGANAAGAGGQEVVAIRSGDFKLLLNAAGNTPELYNLESDPGETTNIALEHPATTRQLAQQALAIRYETPASILPDSLSPIVHLRAENLASTHGTGAPVAVWNDAATGDEVDGTATQNDAARRPMFLPTALNGKAVVQFDGVNDALEGSANNGLPEVSEGITVFAVASSDPSGATAERLGQFGRVAGTPGQAVGLDLSQTTTGVADGGAGFRFNNGAALYDTPIAGGGFHIIAWQVGHGQAYQDATLLVDGALPANTFSGSSNNPTGTVSFTGNDLQLLLGTGRNGALLGNDYYGGQLAELVVYNDQLTVGEINLVGNYLSTEYNLPFAYNIEAVDLFAIDGLAWIGNTANFDAAWNRGDRSGNPEPVNANPFGNGGAEDLFLGSDGQAIYDATTNVSAGTTIRSMRIGTPAAGQIIFGTGGAGTLVASDQVSLTIGDGTAPLPNAPTGNLTVGEGGQTGRLDWNSTGTLNVEGQFRVGQGGVGTVHQNAGTIVAGAIAGAQKFIAVGNGAASTAAYYLNQGQLLPGGGLTGAERRHLRIGYNLATGLLELGDGIGGVGSARLETRDDVYVGHDGGHGTLRIRSDGYLSLSTSDAPLFIGQGPGSFGQIVQTGGMLLSSGSLTLGNGAGATGFYLLSGGAATFSDPGLETRIGANGGEGRLRLEGSATFKTDGTLFIGHQGGSGATGRLEVIGSEAEVQVAKLDNAPGDTGQGRGIDETIRWEADLLGVTPLIVSGIGGPAEAVQLQSPLEVARNAGVAGNLTGDGIALELDLSTYRASGTLMLIDNWTTQPIIGYFERGTTGDLYENGEPIYGTGYLGTVTIWYDAGIGNNDVWLVLDDAIPGDFDGDGDNDGQDFLAWQRQMPPRAVDLDDWQRYYGVGTPPNASLSRPVPEPLSATAGGIALVAIVLCRRFRAS